jgi:hypothetical protein
VSYEATITLRDGSRVSGSREHIDRVRRIERDLVAEERAWIERLRDEGVRAAHPDDGWVNREESYVSLMYPQFNDGLATGSLLALGWPGDNKGVFSGYRIVRVTEIRCTRNIFAVGDLGWWEAVFEEIP